MVEKNKGNLFGIEPGSGNHMYGKSIALLKQKLQISLYMTYKYFLATDRNL